MKRKQFIRGLGIGATSFFVAPALLLGQEDKKEAYSREIVQQFVGAAHSDLDKAKSLLKEFPNLIYASHDWGNGDFETGMGAAGHVGNREIAHFLLEKGARPTLHALTMLGRTELIVPIMEAYPQMIHCLGPHGFTFLHHAEKGGPEAETLLAYFQEKGLTERKIALK